MALLPALPESEVDADALAHLETHGYVILPSLLSRDEVETVRAELEAFAAACRGESRPYVSGESGRRALETALRVRDSIG